MAKYEAVTDEQLIRRLRGGERDITNFIMDKYKHMVRKKAKAMYLLGGENDDLIQEGMIGLFKAVQDYNLDEDTSFASFADLCISRQIYSAIKASQRKKHIPLNSYVSIYGNEEIDEASEDRKPPLIDTIQSGKDNDPEAIFFGKKYMEEIETRLNDELSNLESRVLYLHLLGTDYQTIAKLIDKSPKAVDNALQRIKAKAEKIINKDK